MNDVAIVIVSHHGAPWLRRCLSTLVASLGRCTAEIVVVSNADDETGDIAAEFDGTRFLRCENHGFAHANNVGLATCNARYILFLNIDTEIREGTIEQLLAALDERPRVGIAGVRQVTADGVLSPTIRRFPSVLRTLGEALGAERLKRCPTWLRIRELDLDRYQEEIACDWMSGSFLIVRREVLDEVGAMDERFFLYCEEPDLCLRAKHVGWEIRHMPLMTILHHAGKAGHDPKLEAQNANARIQLFDKHSRFFLTRWAHRAALALGYALRSVAPGFGGRERRRSARAGLKVSLGIAQSPFGSAAAGVRESSPEQNAAGRGSPDVA